MNNCITGLDPKKSKLSPELCMQIVDLFNAWAGLENSLTLWLLVLLDIEDDLGRIVLDRLDTRAKIDRIKDIYIHLNVQKITADLKELSKKYEQWVPIRNMVSHKLCFGLSTDKTHVMYSTGRYTKGDRESIQMVGVAVDDFRRCALFAAETARQIMDQMPAAKMPIEGAGRKP